ncbi:MAG: hypothetical protein K2K44_13310 [Oscillospiraceae bacterium]|nr:hypothetical protein [Oscillospiraceae bacterium]
MIQKAIEKIDGEIKSGGMYERTLGKYVKSELLTSDSNALKILAPNTDLETFTERLQKVAQIINGSVKHNNKPSDKKDDIKSKEEFTAKSNDLGWRIISLIKTGSEPNEKAIAENETDENLIICKLIMETVFANEGNAINGVCLTSEIVIPLMQIYYGIPLEPTTEKESVPKRRRFNTVSLD